MGYLTKQQIAAIIRRSEELRQAAIKAREQLADAYAIQQPSK